MSSVLVRSGLLVVALVGVIGLIGPTRAYLPAPEAKRLCRLRTGLIDKDLSDFKTRNEGCTIDCITKQGTMMTTYAEDGHACHDMDGYKCVLGKCHSPEDKLSKELKSDLYQVEIKIKTAFVADRDPYPTQGESDAFVLVEMVSSGGSPSFKDGEVLCYTHVVQDNSRPRWNFSCRPQPMKSSAQLRFVVLDSDKPDTNPQLLGTANLALETLLNSGPQTLTLDQGKLSGGPYTLDVEVSGSKYA